MTPRPSSYSVVMTQESEVRRRIRLILRRLNLFSPSRTDERPQGNLSGPRDDYNAGARGRG